VAIIVRRLNQVDEHPWESAPWLRPPHTTASLQIFQPDHRCKSLWRREQNRHAYSNHLGAGRALGLVQRALRSTHKQLHKDPTPSGKKPTTLSFSDLTVSASHSTCTLLDIAVRDFIHGGPKCSPRFGHDGGSTVREDCGCHDHSN